MIDEKNFMQFMNALEEAGAEHVSFDNLKRFIDEQPKTGEWIPCGERLPEESLNSVIGWDEYRERCCFVQYYNGRWILKNDAEPVKIVAWQPLPEPYMEALNSLSSNMLTPQERTRNAVAATGNRWAIENFNNTH